MTRPLASTNRHDAGTDPRHQVAVIGMACRVPGAGSAAELWELLAGGGDAVGEVPTDRWSPDAVDDGSAPGARFGGYLADVSGFDADFFRIAPREAAGMDPQQRLALEASWHAVEDAGIDPDTLRDTRTGVFLGCTSADYAVLLGGGADTHAMSGLNRGIIANRISYFLGLRGPSMVLDTAQSSSLVAVDTAVSGLLAGQIDLALAGGVQLNLSPAGAVNAARIGALSPSGKSRAFDAAADGFARGEGVGVVLLKRLDLALRDGDPLYAVILGSAANNDGGGHGLTTPDTDAQIRLLRAAHRASGVTGAEVQYVEAHGTGTRLGDPVEAEALAAVLGRHPERTGRLAIGSVKTNIGHLEAASGVLGLIKTALSISKRRLVPSLHFAQPNPAIDLGASGLSVTVAEGPWPRPEERLVAGVTSIGLGGTNCHVLLAERPAPARSADADPAPGRTTEGAGKGLPVPLVLTAHSRPSLLGQADRLLTHLRTAQDSDLGATAAELLAGRAEFDHRATVLGDTADEVREGLEALRDGLPSARVVTGRATEEPGAVAFLFSGQGSQRAGMGRELAARHPGFAAHLTAVCAVMDRYSDLSMTELFLGSGAGSELIDRTDCTQAALFVVEVALFRTVADWGVTPDRVAGHSIGELAAACCAGMLGLDDACRLVVARGTLMQQAGAAGSMASVQADEDEVRTALAEYAGTVDVAAVNGPASVVVSGLDETVRELVARWTREGRRARLLNVGVAAHSPLLDAMLDDFAAIARTVENRPARIPFLSHLTGETVTGDAVLDTEYWTRHVREAVRFADGVHTLLRRDDVRTLVEVGPDAVLTSMAAEAAKDAGAVVVPLLRKGAEESRTFMSALAALYVRGLPVDWRPAVPARAADRPRLPGYAFTHTPYWAPDARMPGAAPQAREAAEESADVPDVPDVQQGAGPAPLSGADASALQERLTTLVRATAAAVLGHSGPDAIDEHKNFKELGFDSVSAVELASRLSEATGVAVPANAVFDHPRPALLVDFLRRDLAGEPADTARTTVRTIARTPDSAAGGEVAVVGVGCRFAGGVAGLEDLWDVVVSGREAVSGVPLDRGWDAGVFGGGVVSAGSFLADAGGFDAGFFGISPREALGMDPQQRLLLECSWEALENAGIVPATLSGEQVGVFMGEFPSEYGPGLSHGSTGVSGYLMTGTSPSVASGRLSYVLGLGGPSVTVDTACSSSLVAVHLAVASLRRGESSLALAGAATVMSSPGLFVEFSRQGALSPDGRCRAFSADAAGFGLAEGAAVLVLERLEDALAAGHPVLGVVRGSAVNSDGASNGLTAPNGPAQQRVIRAALADAGLAPGDVDVVEAHGTGTRLGDPIEAQALQGVYDAGRERPLWLGSVKSNVGHAQAAAGMAGIVKVLGAFRYGYLPPTRHAERPSTHVEWEGSSLRLLTEGRDWPEDAERVRRAGVSSFGISGTNAHLILEQPPAAPAVAPPEGEEPESVAWVVSARSGEALGEYAERLAARLGELAGSGVSVGDVAHTFAVERSVFEHRAAVVGRTWDELVAGVDALAQGRAQEGVVAARAGRRSGTVFVFPGQGGQWPGMARELLEKPGAFAERMEECRQILADLAGWDLFEVLGDAQALARTEVVQPALCAVNVSLAAWWRAQGVEPDAVVGHSQGEIAAAYVAGALGLEDVLALSVARARAITRLPGGTGMVTVNADAQRLAPWLSEGLVVAAFNSPSSTVVSGPDGELEALLARAEGEGVWARRIKVAYASHHPSIDAIADDLLAWQPKTAPRAGELAFHSTVTGGLLDTARLTAEYWLENLRSPVRFAPTIAELAASCDTFIEISPHPTLTTSLEQILETADRGEDALILPSLIRDADQERTLLLHRASAWAHGHAAPLPAPRHGAHVELPPHPFTHTTYWLNPTTATAPHTHPVLGPLTSLAGTDEFVANGVVGPRTHPWLTDHAIEGVPLVPGTLLLELAQTAADGVGAYGVSELTLHAPLLLTGEHSVQVAVGPLEEGARTVRVHARPAEQEEHAEQEGAAPAEWTLHASGVLAPLGALPATTYPHPAPGAGALQASVLYGSLRERGYAYGEAFALVSRAWSDGQGAAIAEITVPEGSSRWSGLPPAVLDAALHPAVLGTVPGVGGDASGTGAVLLPFSFADARFAPAAHRVTEGGVLRVRLAAGGAPQSVSVTITDQDGAVLAAIGALALRPVAHSALTAPGGTPPLYEIHWDTHEPPAVPATSVTPLGPVTTPVVRVLAAQDGDVQREVIDVAAFVDPAAADAAALATGVVTAVLTRLQNWLAARAEEDEARLTVLTRGARAPRTPAELAAATVVGMVRSVQAEHPGRIQLVDITPEAEPTGEDLAALLADAEAELAWDGTATVPRLRELTRPPSGTGAWHLTAGGGSLDQLTAVVTDADTRPLAPGEIRIAVRCAGVNFRDVLIALGMYPDPGVMGIEAAGVVLEAGADAPFEPGTRVLAFVPDGGAFGPVLTVDARLAAAFPDEWSFEQAATVPVVFGTAYHALAELAGLRGGECVLIHAATGGVGMAAVQLARHLGAEVYATAAPAKHDTLRAMGLDDDHIASSRDLGFAAKFRTVTGGRGVDVVLNALADEFTDASLDLLAEGGRFIEMGKTDLRDPTALATTRPALRYQAFDLTRIAPDHVRRMLDGLLDLFRTGALQPLPVVAEPVHRTQDVFRTLSMAQHTGKRALTLPRRLNPAGTVLITGGTGAVADAVVRHLAGLHGIRRFVLMSRNGVVGDELRAALDAAGALVSVCRGDATRVADVEAAVEAASADPAYPLTAVIHAAGAVDDALVESVTPCQLAAVLAPKAAGVIALDAATRGLDLDAFLLFSSATAAFGNPGQSPYTAANGFLDGYAHFRGTRGEPTVSIGWSRWELSSDLTRHMSAADAQRMARRGMGALEPDTATALFDAALTRTEPHVLATVVDRAAVRRATELPAVLTGMRAAAVVAKAARLGLADTLAGQDAEQQRTMVLALIYDTAASVIDCPLSEVQQPTLSFRGQGFDSLTAIEFRNRIAAATGLRLPATLVFDYPTPQAVTEFLLERLAPQPPETDAAGDGGDEEVRRLLAAVPVRRLREAGLLDPLLALAEPAGPASSDPARPETSDEDIAAMDPDALIALALDQDLS
ncbi:type I polyketide synthase [Streptomyces halobius]|uniref:Type I polyketide synthase n=1 Tax=Streptomyces halobius TaxID=2879846 RepID=A0ABY4MJP1_9ACTN|nr:type I polyketide synthase [Streptomyces halobius]UQA97427.1 type I polyketide synthase [Streptomyces halobius]